MMRVAAHLVAILLLLLTCPDAVFGGKGSKDSGRSRGHSAKTGSKISEPGSGSTSSSSINSSKGRKATNDSGISRSSRERGKGSSPALPDGLFRESDEEQGSPQMSPTMHDLLFQSRCITSDGAFGLGEEGAQEQLVVSFQYAVTLDTSELTQNQYLSTVLPRLETDMNNYVVPVLFPHICGTKHRGLSETHGISSEPADTILDDADFCVDSAGNCYSMLGQITLYLNTTQRSVEDYSASFHATLEKGMNEGFFDNNSPIQSVSFIPMTPDEGADDNGSRGGAVSLEGNDNNSDGPNVHRIIAVTCFSALGLMLFAATIYVVRRNRQRSDNEQMQSLSQR